MLKHSRRFLAFFCLFMALLLFSLALCCCGFLAFVVYAAQKDGQLQTPLKEISDALVLGPSGYELTQPQLLEDNPLWYIFITQDGKVAWQHQKPPELPTRYTLTQVAAFTRWYLADYPVHTYIRPDGLLVSGRPKGSVWKHGIEFGHNTLDALPWIVGFFFLLWLGCLLGLSWLVLRRWFVKEQALRDTARSGWINGISHDVRTPLSLVMGYASELQEDTSLPPARRRQAGLILRQSRVIKELVNDLNLTMRLNYQMQPLRPAALSPAALLRQVGADLCNEGLGPAYPLSLDIPRPLEGLRLMADEFLLRRALLNLAHNCVRHNPDGCAVTLGLRQEQGGCFLWVSNEGWAPLPPIPHAGGPDALGADGGAAHGTGLLLVTQVAQAHGGRFEARGEAHTLVCGLWLPLPP